MCECHCNCSGASLALITGPFLVFCRPFICKGTVWDDSTVTTFGPIWFFCPWHLGCLPSFSQVPPTPRFKLPESCRKLPRFALVFRVDETCVNVTFCICRCSWSMLNYIFVAIEPRADFRASGSTTSMHNSMCTENPAKSHRTTGVLVAKAAHLGSVSPLQGPVNTLNSLQLR
jgi:hypothetical protein